MGDIIDDILNSQKIERENRPDTLEKYLLKRVLDLEDENKLLQASYASYRQNQRLYLDIQKSRCEEEFANHEMLMFMWDAVIDRYDPEKCALYVGGNTINVPGKLQDSFKLWQSFKDNPEGGGV